MTRILRRIFEHLYRIPRQPVVTPLAPETICSCGTVVEADWQYCECCGVKLGEHQ